jgi:putative lipoic acid-binding regulatory protein
MTNEKEQEKESLLTFPCDFPIKVIGQHTEKFVAEILQLTQKHYPDFDKTCLKQQLSKNGQFISLTLTIHALDKKTLDALYQDLSAHPDSKMVL